MPEENIISDETDIQPISGGEGDDRQVEVTRTISKEIVETITVGEARNKADFAIRQLESLENAKDEYLTNYVAEKLALRKEREKYENIISSVEE